jgi:Putative peptidoglycan binding domain
MNTKPLLYLSCALAVATSTAIAGPHRGAGNHFVSMQSRGGVARPFAGGNRFATWSGQRWNGQRFAGSQRFINGNRWNGWNWRRHHRFHDFDDFAFFDFGFPFGGWWGYPYYYGYYPYGFPYGYPYGYGYNNGYYGGNDGGNGYNNSYGYTNGSNVIELQRKLRDAGYYRGPIDGIMGSRTYYALKAYRHDHGNGRNINGGYSPTLRDTPYSPPPVTTEPSPNQ